MAQGPNRRRPDPSQEVGRVREKLNEEGAEISERDVDFIDSLYHDPGERAEWVHALLETAKTEHEADLSDWDTICFAAEFLGQQSIAIGDEQLHYFAKEFLRRIYALHYSFPEVLYGDPEKKPLPTSKRARPQKGQPRPRPDTRSTQEPDRGGPERSEES